MIASKVSLFLVGAAAFIAADFGVSKALPPMIEGDGHYSQSVSAGEIIPIEWTITKRTDCPGLTSRAWYGESSFQLTEPAQTTTLPKSDWTTYNIQTKIPELAPPGDLELHIVGQFDCGRGPVPFKIGPVALVVTE